MSGPNFGYINQFKRNGHAPLPKNEKVDTYWVGNNPFRIDPAETQVGTTVDPETGQWKFVYKSRSTGKSMSVSELMRQSYDALLKKYPRPPQGPSCFMQKETIPRGIDDKHPFGNPSIWVRPIPTFPIGTITREGLETLHRWLASFVRT